MLLLSINRKKTGILNLKVYKTLFYQRVIHSTGYNHLQVNACCNITAIPRSDVAEMTGAISSAKRILLWQANRVFFLTPQVMQNDLSSGICPAKEIVCCVIDEAHKALGNYAYCQVVRELVVNRVQFRVLGLSATPGDDLGAIQEVSRLIYAFLVVISRIL